MAISADLGETLENYVTKLVAKGRYNSKSEVLREGIRLLQEREAKMILLDRMVEAGIRDIDAGKTTAAEGLFAGLEAKYAAMAKKAIM